MAAKNDDRITVRLPADLLATFEEIQAKHALGTPEIARRCLEAVATFYRTNGYFAFPIRIWPEAEFLTAVSQTPINTAETGADRARLASAQAGQRAAKAIAEMNRVDPPDTAPSKAGKKARAEATGVKTG